MSTARKAYGVVLVFLGMLGYGGVAGAEYVMRDAPIPIAMLAQVGFCYGWESVGFWRLRKGNLLHG